MGKKKNDDIFVTLNAFGDEVKIKINNFKSGDELNRAMNAMLRLSAAAIVATSQFLSKDFEEDMSDPDSPIRSEEDLAFAVSSKFGEDLKSVISNGFSSVLEAMHKESKKKGGDA